MLVITCRSCSRLLGRAKAKEMLVIGAGYGMTGTSSLQIALTKLLNNGPICALDTIRLGESNEAGTLTASDPACWMKVLDAKVTGDAEDVRYLLRKMLGSYAGAVDWPACIFYQELMSAFPEAKVILTVREKKKWYRSVFETLHSLRVAQNGTWLGRWLPKTLLFNQFMDKLIWVGPNSVFKGEFCDEARATEIYDDWVEEVKLVVPPERLLVFSVTEGYEPLCEFLNLPEPNKKHFPKVNEAKRFAKSIAMTKQFDHFKYLLYMILAVVALFGMAQLSLSAERNQRMEL